MHDIRTIDIKEDIFAENDRIAADVNHGLTHKNVFAVNVMGAPGAGKTTVLLRLIGRLKTFRPVVIEGDIESDLDTRTMIERGVPAYQINTFGACHLDAPLIRDAVREFDFGSEKTILFIENVGNLVCPAEFQIGEHIKMLICSVTEGSDKPYKYPLAFREADIVLLNKIDLCPYIDFDEEFFTKGFRALNKESPLLKVSGKTGEGFAEAASLLEEMAASVLCRHDGHDSGSREHDVHEHNGREHSHEKL